MFGIKLICFNMFLGTGKVNQKRSYLSMRVKDILKIFIVSVFGISLFSACASKPDVSKIILEQKVVYPNTKDPYKLFPEKIEDKFYSDAKLAKVWVDTHVTDSNIRVREQFIDIWVKQASFENTDIVPEDK